MSASEGARLAGAGSRQRYRRAAPAVRRRIYFLMVTARLLIAGLERRRV
jgi:hypothetical protein